MPQLYSAAGGMTSETHDSAGDLIILCSHRTAFSCFGAKAEFARPPVLDNPTKAPPHVAERMNRQVGNCSCANTKGEEDAGG